MKHIQEFGEKVVMPQENGPHPDGYVRGHPIQKTWAVVWAVVVLPKSGIPTVVDYNCLTEFGLLDPGKFGSKFNRLYCDPDGNPAIFDATASEVRVFMRTPELDRKYRSPDSNVLAISISHDSTGLNAQLIRTKRGYTDILFVLYLALPPSDVHSTQENNEPMDTMRYMVRVFKVDT
jgi:hypothetical protein